MTVRNHLHLLETRSVDHTSSAGIRETDYTYRLCRQKESVGSSVDRKERHIGSCKPSNKGCYSTDSGMGNRRAGPALELELDLVVAGAIAVLATVRLSVVDQLDWVYYSRSVEHHTSTDSVENLG